MMGFKDAGDPLTDEELLAEIAQYRKAVRDVAMGGGIGKVSGEGRLLEFTRSNALVASAALRDLLTVARGRGLPIAGDIGAIAVEIGRHG